jgi:hypothetical protein
MFNGIKGLVMHTKLFFEVKSISFEDIETSRLENDVLTIYKRWCKHNFDLKW